VQLDDRRGTNSTADFRATLRGKRLFKLLGIRARIYHLQKFARQLSINVWNVLLLAALFHKSPSPGALLMKHFPAFVTAYRESLTASSSVTYGIVNAAANINHCYSSVKLWLLLERMLSQTPESPDGHTPIPKAMPFVIWNELWTPFSDLITAYEADVARGQDTVRATSHILRTARLPKSQDAMERDIVRRCGSFPILEGVSFSLGVGDRGARGHP